MQKLINMLNAQPGVNIREADVVFSKPVFVPLYGVDQVNIKSVAKGKGYIDKTFTYKRYDLTKMFTGKLVELVVSVETNTHQLLYSLNKLNLFPYQLGSGASAQDFHADMAVQDVVNKAIPTIPEDGLDFEIEAAPDSYYFRGKFTVKLIKSAVSNEMVSLDFFHDIIIK